MYVFVWRQYEADEQVGDGLEEHEGPAGQEERDGPATVLSHQGGRPGLIHYCCASIESPAQAANRETADPTTSVRYAAARQYCCKIPALVSTWLGRAYPLGRTQSRVCLLQVFSCQSPTGRRII